MRTVTQPADVGLAPTVLSIGNFDGVHLGHRGLLARMSELASQAGLPAVAISFFPTSKMVFSGSGFLSSTREKTLLLSEFNPEVAVLIPFSREYAQTEPAVFLDELRALRPAAVTVGVDFRFGRDRQGTLNDISLVTGKLEVFGLIRSEDGEVISSSRIRELLALGDVDSANRLLGAPYLAVGQVVPGDRRGRTIGYPTANLQVQEGKVLPAGVFAVTVKTDAGRFTGMASAGPRPMFPEAAPALEVNLFDFDGDLYGQELEVRFVGRIRDQENFASLEELKLRLAEDGKRARALLAGLEQ